MKHLIQYKVLFGLVLLLSGYTANCQVHRQNKSIVQSFKIESSTELTVKNKYGNIQLLTWDKDSVKFVVTIDVRNKKEAKALSILDDLYVDFVTSKHFLEARTSSLSSESFWTDIKDKTGNLFSSDNKIQVNYKIYLPITMALNIENKYGDIMIDDHQGATEITLSNGDLRAHSFLGGTTINLKFAYANIKQMVDGRLNLGYQSEIQLGEANDLVIESKSSRVKINSVSKLDVKSHRDKYYIDKVGEFKAHNSYTYLEIETLENYLSVDATYGNIDIKNIDDSVSKLFFNVESTDIHFTKPSQREIRLKLVYDEKTGIFFPEELQNKETTKKDEEKKLVETTGQLGATSANPLQVNATLLAGNIRVVSN